MTLRRLPDGALILRWLTYSVTVFAGTTRLLRAPRLDPGVTLTIAPDGEVLIL